MSFIEKLQSLHLESDAIATLTYSEGADVFLMNEDEVETALSETNVVQQFSELITTPGINATTPFGTNIIGELRHNDYLLDYERGSFSFSDYISETIRDNFYELDFIDKSVKKYDYKRGFCTLTAEIQIPVAELINERPHIDAWTISVPTKFGTVTVQ
jgi:hypothetical protein